MEIKIKMSNQVAIQLLTVVAGIVAKIVLL